MNIFKELFSCLSPKAYEDIKDSSLGKTIGYLVLLSLVGVMVFCLTGVLLPNGGYMSELAAKYEGKKALAVVTFALICIGYSIVINIANGILALISSKNQGVQLSFNELYAITARAMTLPTILYSLVICTRIFLPFAFIIAYLATGFIMSAVLKYIKAQREQEKREAEIQEMYTYDTAAEIPLYQDEELNELIRKWDNI